MHLKQLKLAGFKSFVEPTVVYFPSQLVAVVGPNGCGKSNIIDAVRWVMGESSARNLRGESMVDVIFNGSSQRKALGQASVELIFDNSLGRLIGPFASYAEIAVKRVVTRDGDSTYYLNGSRCRRKDITDIFLGTGSGARGYSIIGQGTISQLIEAKPEELRVHLEEAAGVSKYKERRKETLQRIKHTRDNLERIADICEELDKQLQRLERQASAAKRYLVLKEDEKLCRAQILVLKWQDLSQQQALKHSLAQELVLKQESCQSHLAKQHTQKIKLNEKCFDLDASNQLLQKEFYHLGTEIARLEESIQQHQREKKRLEQDVQQIQSDWQKAEKQLQEDEEFLNQSQQQLNGLDTRWQHAKASFVEEESKTQKLQQQKSLWEEQWQSLQDQRTHWHQEQQTISLKINYSQQHYQQTVLRLEKLQDEKESIHLEALQEVKEALEVKQLILDENHRQEEEKLQLCQWAMDEKRLALQDIEQQLHRFQDEFYQKNTQLAALSAAQKAAGALVQKDIEAFSKTSRLMETLQVESHWQSAMEMVLGESLQAYVLTDLASIWEFEATCIHQGAHFLKMTAKSVVEALDYPCLLNQIQGDMPAQALALENIFTALNKEQALEWLPHIASHQSIITPEGLWLSHHWVRFSKQTERNEPGPLARQKAIQALSALVQDLNEQVKTLKSQREVIYEDLQEKLQTLQLTQRQVKEAQDCLNQHCSLLQEKSQTYLHAKQRQTALLAELDELQQVLQDLAYEQEELLVQQEHIADSLQEKTLAYEEGLVQNQNWQRLLQEGQQTFEESRQILHEAELAHVHENNKIEQVQTRIAQEKEQLLHLEERLFQGKALQLQNEAPNLQLEEQLQAKILLHQALEKKLLVSQQDKSYLKEQLEQLEKTLVQEEETQKQLQEALNRLRLEENALEVRAANFLEALAEMNMEMRSLLETLPAHMTLSQREEDLLALIEKIKRLGAINLAAIEEFESEALRKKYLDEQRQDLMEALSTLEQAIEKMDKETKERLAYTFAQVNASFKALFPKLFGGGKAQLELTCENLLEAGIVVMAQPPGKRNSTIHLLSGGEKAMTAVALVFAIFQLNPSPFCMLDEVDAPLDDVNVGRFCTLVKEMSKFVQFLFITHNKVTMELADHLMGVTMREPGVSRLVAVDVTQALAME